MQFPAPGLSAFADLLENLFQQSPLFSGLAQKDIYPALANIIKIRHVQVGDIFIRQGDQGRALFLLLKGGVAVTSKDGECVYATLSSGAHFGELSMVTENIRRTATVIATERSVIGTLQCHDLKNIIFPKFGHDIEHRLQQAADSRVQLLHPSQRKYLHMSADKLDTIFNADATTKPDSATLDIVSTSPPNDSRDIPYPVSMNSGYVSANVSPSESNKSCESLPLMDTLTSNDISPSSTGSKNHTESVISSPNSSISPASLAQNDTTISNRDVPSLNMTVSENNAPINKFLLSTAENNPARRRASIAVWSDPRLLSRAQASQNSTPAPTMSSQVGSFVKSQFNSLASVGTSTSFSSTSTGSQILEGMHASSSSILSHQKVPLTLVSLFAKHAVACRMVGFLDIRTCYSLLGCCKDLEHWFLNQREHWCKCVNLNGVKAVNDSVLLTLARNCSQHVQHLNFKGCYSITDTGISAFLESSPKLRSINLHGCWDISLQSFTTLQLPKCLPSMQSLNLSNLRKVDNKAIRKCLVSFPNLEILILGYCKSLTGEMFKNETYTMPVSNTPSTEVDDCVNTKPKSPIQTSSSTNSSNSTWQNLKILNLQRCTGLKDDGFILWPQISISWNLEVLLLGDCSLLSDTAISKIASTCPNLHTLSLTFCCALSETAMNHIVLLKRLKILDLSFCGSLVSMASVTQLTQHCLLLERLGLRGCCRVNDALATVLLETATNLKIVNLGQCGNLSASFKTNVATRRWILLDTENVIDFAST